VTPYVDVAGRFGDNLIRCRKFAGLSQDELGVRASVHRTEISQLERGLRIPRLDTVVKLAASLEAPVTDLLVGLNWEPGATVYGAFASEPDDSGD
jgi:transcriptional regulator with XRE-family HTH domain